MVCLGMLTDGLLTHIPIYLIKWQAKIEGQIEQWQRKMKDTNSKFS